MAVGIDLISCYCPKNYLDLKTLAAMYEKDPAGYYEVLGQERMAVPSTDEDIITLAANAAWPIIKQIGDVSKIKTVYFATESAIDQSKSSGMYLHRLFGLSSDCRVVELKQACYSGTFALRAACNEASINPDHWSLIVNSDIARYGHGTPGEPTQGAGAVALLVKDSPRIATIDNNYGVYAEDAMDFWRPNYRQEAFVDGQYSVRLYIKSLLAAWENYQTRRKLDLQELSHMCFHLPFSTIAEKAYSRLAKKNQVDINDETIKDKIHPALRYNRQTGNCYTASLYQSLTSLLDTETQDLSNHEVGLFSYGSGSVAEFFTGKIQEGYQSVLFKDQHTQMFDNREELTYSDYKSSYQFSLPQDGQEFQCPRQTNQRFRLAGVNKHKRIYETQKQFN